MTKAEIIKKTKRRALIGENMLISIGINKYNKKGDCLNNCESDATQVYSTFEEHSYLSMASGSQLILSGDGSATTKKAIFEVLSNMRSKMNDNTNIIFYYSGHGCISNGKFYFFVSDSEASVTTMISLDELLEVLKNSNNGRHGNITVLIDACCEKVTNRKGLQNRSDNYITNHLRDAKGIGVIFSCSEGEYSLDKFNDQEISVFTSFLLDALKGQEEALDGNFLTFNTMYNYIATESRLASMSNTQIKQHPKYHFEGNDIIYALLDDTDIRKAKVAHHIFSFEEEIYGAIGELYSLISIVSIEKAICVDDDEWSIVPSFNYIYTVCKELDKMGYLYPKWEEPLNTLFYYKKIFEQKKIVGIPQHEQKMIIDEIWDFLYSIPT